MSEGHTDVRMPILSLDTNLDTGLLRYLFRPAKRPMEPILTFFLGHPLASRPFSTVVVPSEADISRHLILKKMSTYKSEDPLMSVHSSPVKVGILSPSSFETDSGKWPRSDDQLIVPH